MHIKRNISVFRLLGKENLVDRVLSKESTNCLFYNILKHIIHSTKKNSWIKDNY